MHANNSLHSIGLLSCIKQLLSFVKNIHAYPDIRLCPQLATINPFPFIVLSLFHVSSNVGNSLNTFFCISSILEKSLRDAGIRMSLFLLFHHSCIKYFSANCSMLKFKSSAAPSTSFMEPNHPGFRQHATIHFEHLQLIFLSFNDFIARLIS